MKKPSLCARKAYDGPAGFSRPAPARIAEPVPLPTKEALAAALTLRYGGRPVAPDDVVDRMFCGEEFQFQAFRNAMVDWYKAPVDSTGQVDHARIQQLPF